MVHDEMVTVPPKTATPPPCKQQAECEPPMKVMGTFECLCSTYTLQLTGALAAVVQA